MESHPPPQFLRCLVFASIISLGVVSAVTILFVAGDRHHSLFPVSSPSLSSSGWSKYFSLRNQEKYSTLQETSAIDASIERRAKEQSNANDCSNLMVYLPDQFAFHGHGSQINTCKSSVSINVRLMVELC